MILLKSYQNKGLTVNKCQLSFLVVAKIILKMTLLVEVSKTVKIWEKKVYTGKSNPVQFHIILDKNRTVHI